LLSTKNLKVEMKIIIITGRSGSGKTTLIEKLILHFKKQGKSIAAIKSMRHDFEIDYKGKDSARYKEAGAMVSAITNGKKLAIVADIDEKTTPLDIAHKYLSHCDIVIIEGFKEAKHKKIEVIGNLEEEPLFANDSNIILVVSDMEIKTNLPVIKRDDIEKLTAFIEENF